MIIFPNRTHLHRALLAAAIFGGLIQQCQAQSAGTPFIQMVGQLESGGVTTATNPNSTSTGMYQDTQAALAQAGILTINSQPTAAQFGVNGNWDNVTFQPNQYGITSRQDLLNASPQVQTAIENQYLSSVYQQDQAQGLTNYLGQTVNGQQINQSALLGCSEYLGTSGCNTYLQTGSAGNLTAGAEQLISQYSQADSSAITGAPTTQVAQSQPGLAPGQEDYAGAGMYCNPAASQVLNTASQQSVANAVAIAENPQTGYSLINGSGILAPQSGGYQQYSCLNNLFNNGLNVIFQVPNLSQILGELENAACTEVESVVQQALAPLNQNFYQSTNIDGFSLGGAGVSVGQSGTPGLTTNLGTPGGGLAPGSIEQSIAGQAVGNGFGQAPVTYGGAY